MKWLEEFYRRWQMARGRRIRQTGRSFSQQWIELLEHAGVTSAEDQATACREAEALEASGRLILRRHRYRKYLVERVALPQDSESWLIEHFGGISAPTLQAESLAVLASFETLGHPVYPREWAALCEALRTAFSNGRSLRPFHWNQPGQLKSLLDIIGKLTARDWPVGTPIRAASVGVGLDSKHLERYIRTYEAGISRMFGAEISLKTLGLMAGDSHIELHGPVRLHFPDGSIHDFSDLTFPVISAADLARCTSISTTARGLLTIENRKTTFRQYAAANDRGDVLLAATSYPSAAFRDFLVKLPPDLSHCHFGDTDPAGWQILLKLRQASSRPVKPFLMKWRQGDRSHPLTAYDRQLLPKLLVEPLLSDVRSEVAAIANHGDRGDFEQKTLGPPGLFDASIFR